MVSLLCENHFCIYRSKGRCILDQISLDMQGCCDECIYVTIPEELLAKERETILNSYKAEYASWKKE